MIVKIGRPLKGGMSAALPLVWSRGFSRLDHRTVSEVEN